jgi:hypothetical protein
MPDDRFLHKRGGHGRKLQSLPDFEYRVWTCYEMSADDFGVMRANAVTLQADHDRLAKHPAARVVRALESAVAVGLLMAFDHQGQRYVCQSDWQTFQKVEYPRPTSNPIPPPEILAECDEPTRQLFSLYPGGKRRKKGDASPTNPQSVSEDSPKVPGSFSHLAGARDARMATATATATAEGKGTGETQDDDRKTRGRDSHRRHAYCGTPPVGRFCLPVFLHQEFERALGDDRDGVDLLGWYREADERAAADGFAIRTDELTWWRQQFKQFLERRFMDPTERRRKLGPDYRDMSEEEPPITGEAPPEAPAPPAPAGCQHDPRCQSFTQHDMRTARRGVYG